MGDAPAGFVDFDGFACVVVEVEEEAGGGAGDAAGYGGSWAVAELGFGFEQIGDVAERGGSWGDLVLGVETLEEPVTKGFRA